ARNRNRQAPVEHQPLRRRGAREDCTCIIRAEQGALLAGKWWRRPLGEYDGRLMRCAPGTHEAAAAIVTRHVAKDARVLDLASGTGAFLARLRDLGYANLDAVELNVDGFRLDGVTPRPVDLNSTFADQLPHQYGLISAIEIIEHLDCPRHFLRDEIGRAHV